VRIRAKRAGWYPASALKLSIRESVGFERGAYDQACTHAGGFVCELHAFPLPRWLTPGACLRRVRARGGGEAKDTVEGLQRG